MIDLSHYIIILFYILLHSVTLKGITMGSVNLDQHTKKLALEICEEKNRNISNLVQTLIKRYHKKIFGGEK